MTNTERSFRDKWEKNEKAFFEITNKEGSEIQNWILNRNGWKDLKELREFLKNKKRILDAGCGNGRVTKLLRENSPCETEIIGIDLVSASIAHKNLKGYKNIFFYERDLLSNLRDLGKFDFIYCQEVLHHTKDPRTAFNNLIQILEEEGIIAIYVYKKKAPIREFTDDYIRNIIKK
ncbi:MULTISPECIES: class I SAM-dependent methyltransferase [Thermodesulfovibrio]|uniref:class I SAM-dependent methyltransferase n=1 Tax=Thermodesulfovibrio TaxID=28261 RepID=UPI0026094800|nr:class I SAM-dependent methyltransferase [Thermodesulfovibrio sp.]